MKGFIESRVKNKLTGLMGQDLNRKNRCLQCLEACVVFVGSTLQMSSLTFARDVFFLPMGTNVR